MDAPYRTPAAPESQPAVSSLVDERQPPSRALHARGFSDGTTEIRVRSRSIVTVVTLFFIGTLLLLFGLAAMLDSVSVALALMSGGLALIGWGVVAWRGERIVVDRNALVRRARLPWRSNEVYLLDEIGAVGLSSVTYYDWLDECERRRSWLELGHQAGQIVIRLGKELSADELDWIERRIERAIDDARRARQ